jgi:hypothetical protein
MLKAASAAAFSVPLPASAVYGGRARRGWTGNRRKAQYYGPIQGPLRECAQPQPREADTECANGRLHLQGMMTYDAPSSFVLEASSWSKRRAQAGTSAAAIAASSVVLRSWVVSSNGTKTNAKRSLP